MPLLSGASVVGNTADTLRAEVVVDAADEVFDGHYPGFAMLPGMYLLDLVQHLVIQHGHDSGSDARLTAVHSARFSSVVRPGDTVTVDCAITHGHGWRDVRAGCVSGSGRVASFDVRLTDVDRQVDDPTAREYAAGVTESP